MYRNIWFIILVSPTFLLSEGLYRQYQQTQNEINKVNSIDKREAENLNKSILNAVKQNLIRVYQYKKFNDITIQDIQFEPSKYNIFTYYIKYKEFVGYLSFPNDPKKHMSIPSQERILLKPGTSIEEFQSLLKDDSTQSGVGQKTSK